MMKSISWSVILYLLYFLFCNGGARTSSHGLHKYLHIFLCYIFPLLLTIPTRSFPFPCRPSQVYVQHRIRESGAQIWKLLQDEGGAHIFVSGSASKMPTDVTNALIDVIQKEGGMDVGAATKYIGRLEKAGRFCIEAWS